MSDEEIEEVFPLVQLPKKFKAENEKTMELKRYLFPLVQLPKKFKVPIPVLHLRQFPLVSISSTSEEVQSFFASLAGCQIKSVVSISSTSEEVQRNRPPFNHR